MKSLFVTLASTMVLASLSIQPSHAQASGAGAVVPSAAPEFQTAQFQAACWWVFDKVAGMMVQKCAQAAGEKAYQQYQQYKPPPQGYAGYGPNNTPAHNMDPYAGRQTACPFGPGHCY